MLHNIRYGVRMLRRAPGFTLLAVTALACGTRLVGSALEAQTSTRLKTASTLASPAFEVASIRPALAAEIGSPPLCITPCDPLEHLKVDGSRVDFRHFSLRSLILGHIV
jgi:hypothetical protein